MLISRSKAHLQEAGKAYGLHGKFAVKAGFLLIFAGVASIIHGLIPACFPFLSRDIVRSLTAQSQREQEDRPPK